MNLFLIFPRFASEHISKDVYLFPKYMAEQLNAELYICFDRSNDLNYSFDDNVKVKDLALKGHSECSFMAILKQIFFIYKNRNDIDLLVLFHYRWYSLILSLFYKLLKSSGKVYIKSDMPLNEASNVFNQSSSFIKKLRRIIYLNLARVVDVISFEVKDVYDAVKSSTSSDYIKSKFRLIPNGYVSSTDSHHELIKENMFLTVGRLGTYQKNTEFLLDVIEGLNLKDWTFHFVGPVQDSFAIRIEEFYARNPHLVKSVFFEGCISDLALKNSFYERAKVFVLPSRYESYGLVLLEAASYNCHLISTNVGAINDLISIYNCSGQVLEQDIECFRNKMQKIIDCNIYPVSNDVKSLEMNDLVHTLINFIYCNRKI